MTSWSERVRVALGPGFSDREVEEAAALAQERLEVSVGTRLADGLTDAELEEFEAVCLVGDDAAMEWLSAHCPNYRETVEHESRRVLQKVASIRA